MGRKYTEDTTNVYRQKVTRKGFRPPSRWVPEDAGNHYETVEFYGPYLTRNVGGNPWISGDEVVRVERQKLEVVEGMLEWVTEASRLFEAENSED